MEPIATKARLLSALLYAAGRFVPLPFVDDLLREQVALYAVTRAAQERGQSVPRSHLAPLSAPASGCFSGCLGVVLLGAIKLLLFPVRKVLNWVFGVRGLTRDVVEIVLLCRLVDRAVARGEISGSRSAEAQRVEALMLRRALDAALKNTDLHILGATLRAALGPLRGVMLAGLSALRVMRKQHTDGAPTGESAKLSESTSRLERAFDQPEVRALIESLDAQVDGHLLRLRAEQPRASV